MRSLKTEIETVFRSGVENVRFLLAGERGLEVTFNETALPLSFTTNRDAVKTLAKRFGFMVLREAFVQSLPANLQVSKALSPDGSGLDQDPFHRDAFHEGAKNCTVLYKPLYNGRAAPTFYAEASAVQEAIAQLADTQTFLPRKVRRIMQAMTKSGFSFALTSSELSARETVMAAYPSFTGDVFDVLPEDQRYRHVWESGERALIVHSNTPKNILHARPASTTDFTNVLQASGI